MGRWGEKVPAAVGTVAYGLAVLQLRALNLERAGLPAEGTKPSTVGTGELLAQGVGLLFEQGLQGALGEAGSGGLCDLLHSGEIDIESGAVIAEGASGDDFAPLGGEAAELLDFVGGEVAVWHDASCVEVRTRAKEQLPSVRLGEELDMAKLFMTSFVNALKSELPPNLICVVYLMVRDFRSPRGRLGQ